MLAAAGVIGFIGNEIAAQVRLRAGRRLESPALIADGYHARTDGFVSLAVIASAIVLAAGVKIADPIIGLAISLVIMRITWQSFRTVQAEPGHGEFGEQARDAVAPGAEIASPSRQAPAVAAAALASPPVADGAVVWAMTPSGVRARAIERPTGMGSHGAVRGLFGTHEWYPRRCRGAPIGP